MNSRKHNPAPKRSKRWLGWLLALVLLIAIIIFWHIHNKHKRQEEEQNKPPSVHVASPKPAPAETTITLPGTIQAIQETPIYARTNGYLAHWYHDIGAEVAQGELLAEIDTPDIDQQLIQTKGLLHQAQANMELARITALRWQQLLKVNAVSKQETDEKIANYKALQATVESEQGDVGRITYLQSFKKLYAPFNGVVTERTVDNGALIDSGSNSKELFKVAEIDTVKIYVGVPQSEERAIQPGIEAQILLKEFPDQSFTGKVARSSHEIDLTARTLLTEIDIPNNDGALLPGMYAQARFHFPNHGHTLIVPASVIIIHEDAPHVMMVGEDNILHLVQITIGRDFGQETEITQGLTPDVKMVSNPSDSLVDGEKVNIAPEKQEKPKAPKQDNDNGKDKKDGKDEKSSNSDKHGQKHDEGETPPKQPDKNANIGNSSQVLDTNDTLPNDYRKSPGQDGDKDNKKDKDTTK